MALPVFFPTNGSPNVLFAVALLAVLLASFVHLQTIDNEMIELQRDKLCKQYGQHFKTESSLWPHVKLECIRRVFETKSWMSTKGNTTAMSSLSADVVKEAEKAYYACESRILNPCNDASWSATKTCLRDHIPAEMTFDTIKNSTRAVFSLYAHFNRCTKDLVKKGAN